MLSGSESRDLAHLSWILLPSSYGTFMVSKVTCEACSKIYGLHRWGTLKEKHTKTQIRGIKKWRLQALWYFSRTGGALSNNELLFDAKTWQKPSWCQHQRTWYSSANIWQEVLVPSSDELAFHPKTQSNELKKNTQSEVSQIRTRSYLLKSILETTWHPDSPQMANLA